jgi:hypothetical protein
VRSLLAGLALVAVGASSAWAQTPVTISGGVDLTNQYNFRGIRQNTAEISIWPFVDLGVPAWSGDGALKSVTFNLGTWNAMHTQLAGSKAYETDLYATVGFGFSQASLGFTYTSYTSPGDYFVHVKELAVKASVDDSGALGRAALKPYALVAFELSDNGQADAGVGQGTYLELGVAPGYAGSRASVAFPVKVGLSANDYYEFAMGSDSRFGFFSVGAIVTVPLGSHWNIHGGGEYQAFGDNLKAYNGQDGAGLASIGIGFSY